MKNGVPKKELQQNRNVLQHFNIGGSEPRNQPVGRKTGDPDNRPQEDGQNDPDQGNFQGIQNPDRRALA